MSCFVTFLGLLLDKQQHFCEAMCDHMQVHVYILLFAKYGKHKLTINMPLIHSKEVLTKATVSNKEKIHVKAANSIYPHPIPVIHS